MKYVRIINKDSAYYLKEFKVVTTTPNYVCIRLTDGAEAWYLKSHIEFIDSRERWQLTGEDLNYCEDYML